MDDSILRQVFINTLLEQNPSLAEAMSQYEKIYETRSTRDVEESSPDDAEQDRLCQLAQAVGACKFCWGDDPLCTECLGHGSPGYYASHPAYFRKYLIPAFRRMRSQRLDSNRKF